jgi:prevent-host-death family protein
MRTYSTNEARNKFSEMIDNSQHEAVEIIRHGRTMSVLLSKKDFERLQKAESYLEMEMEKLKKEDEKVRKKIEKEFVKNRLRQRNFIKNKKQR